MRGALVLVLREAQTLNPTRLQPYSDALETETHVGYLDTKSWRLLILYSPGRCFLTTHYSVQNTLVGNEGCSRNRRPSPGL